VDFGLAKANSQLEITDEGVVKGKFSYLSPEACEGMDVDHRADVFALGIILWEMLTGHRLFYADNPHRTVSLVRAARIPSMIAINPTIEPELDEIVRKALARDRDERYATCADFENALAHYVFTRQMKCTAKDVALEVRDMRVDKQRRASTKQQLIDALVKDEINRLTSLVAEELGHKKPVALTDTTDDMVDTKDWAGDLGLDEPK
jgi:eukaryotic-like serine/threonine-protein kinase